jgi:CheY-like chemotaxis protein
MILFNKSKISDLKIFYDFEEIKKRIKIVIIDDDEFSFPFKMLQESGYTIEWWDKIDEKRLDRLERNHFDIIILDINDITDETISTKDGIGILERLKHVNPYQIIVAFSGREYDIETTSFFKMADDSLKKPVDFIKSKDLIDRIIEQKINLAYLWGSLEQYLIKEGVENKKIKKIEAELISSIKHNRKFDSIKISDKILKGSEIGLKAASIILKIITLIGI